MTRVPHFPGSFAIAVLAALVLAAPGVAQSFEDNGTVFSNKTSAEQAVIFDRGVEAYDAGNFEQAFEIWLPLAQRGNMAAQRNVGHLLRRGLGVEQDHARAIYFYTRASESGLVSAMVNLASMLRAGQGVDGPQNREAARWLFIASRAGDPRAQYVLGVMAARGQGMEQNRELAIELFRLAAEQGLREARERLAEAGIDPSNIGDEPERAETEAPASLEPLPEVGPAPEVALAAPATTTQPQRNFVQPLPQQTLIQPEPQLRRTQPVEDPAPEPEPVQQAAPQPVVQQVAQPSARPVVTQSPPPPAIVQSEPDDEPAPEDETPLGRLLGGTR